MALEPTVGVCVCVCVSIYRAAKVVLRLQPPFVDLRTLELGNSRVLCAAASPDNTLLAVGCERGDGAGPVRFICS